MSNLTGWISIDIMEQLCRASWKSTM